jgi:hypothetical protein
MIELCRAMRTLGTIKLALVPSIELLFASRILMGFRWSDQSLMAACRKPMAALSIPLISTGHW